MNIQGPDYRYHTLVVTVENKSGVLARVASLFARRAFNIESLAVAPTDDEMFSRITVVVDLESAPLDQIVKQLDKLVNVVEIRELHPGHAVERELMLVTVSAEPDRRDEIVEHLDNDRRETALREGRRALHEKRDVVGANDVGDALVGVGHGSVLCMNWVGGIQVGACVVSCKACSSPPIRSPSASYTSLCCLTRVSPSNCGAVTLAAQ